MATQEEIVKEFQSARDRYYELLARVINQKIPGVIDEVAAKCGVGEVCHGGQFALPDIRVRPEARG